MKVVLFCGGLGMRLREYSDAIPKPLVPLGHRPILWHIMKYYAHYGHRDFILCLGWKGELIKEYFLNYNECLSNDFVMTSGGTSIELLNSDIQNWRITFVDTGLLTNIGQRLKRVEGFLEGETTFLANYTDGLSDLPLPQLIDFHRQSSATVSFISVKPAQTFHCVTTEGNGQVTSIQGVSQTNARVNAGFFVCQQEIFDLIQTQEELVEEPFQRLIQQEKLFAYAYDGFYGCMDTFKEKQMLDDLYSSGNPPWQIWNRTKTQNATFPLGTK